MTTKEIKILNQCFAMSISAAEYFVRSRLSTDDKEKDNLLKIGFYLEKRIIEHLDSLKEPENKKEEK